MKKNPGGQPPLLTPAELKEKIEEYFAIGVRKRKVVVGASNNRRVEEIEVPTITGLVLFCGYADRRSFYDLEKVPRYTHIIKTARTRIENNYEELMQTVGGAGPIFALKNFGWVDHYDIPVGNQTTVILFKASNKVLNETERETLEQSGGAVERGANRLRSTSEAEPISSE